MPRLLLAGCTTHQVAPACNWRHNEGLIAQLYDARQPIAGTEGGDGS